MAAAGAVYTEPNYILAPPTTAILSEARPLHLSVPALLSLNYLLDELLHLAINASLGALRPNSTTPNSPSSLSPGPLAPDEVLTTERFKTGLIRIVGPLLGKEAVLEAELAVRELLRLGAPSMRGDPSLRKSSFGPSTTTLRNGSAASLATSAQADDIFRSLRAFIQIISGLGVACPTDGPAVGVARHLIAITPPPRPPSPASPHLTFITALYAERCLTHIADYIVRAVGRVTERESRKDAAGLKELEAALGEDEAIWNWLRNMRVRAYIESEVAALNARSSNSSGQAHHERGGSIGGSPAMRRSTIAGSSSRTSHDSSSSVPGLYGKKDREVNGLGILDANGDDFEQLMLGGKTMKVSLTPDRLRTMEKRDRARATSTLATSASMPSLGAPTAQAQIPFLPSTRRFIARTAIRGNQIDEDEDDEDDELLNRHAKRRPKESLLELLGSPPPWSDNAESFASPTPSSGPSGRTRKLSIRRAVESFGGGSSVAMAPQKSQNSVLSQESILSTGSGSDYSESTAARPRGKALKPKDERGDLAHERQINYDLVDFFANAPPPVPPAENLSRSADPTKQRIDSSVTKKKSGGIRGFMSKVKGSSTGSFTSSKGGQDSDSVSVATTVASAARSSASDVPSRRAYGQAESLNSPPISPISPSKLSESHSATRESTRAPWSTPPVSPIYDPPHGFSALRQADDFPSPASPPLPPIPHGSESSPAPSSNGAPPSRASTSTVEFPLSPPQSATGTTLNGVRRESLDPQPVRPADSPPAATSLPPSPEPTSRRRAAPPTPTTAPVWKVDSSYSVSTNDDVLSSDATPSFRTARADSDTSSALSSPGPDAVQVALDAELTTRRQIVHPFDPDYHPRARVLGGALPADLEGSHEGSGLPDSPSSFGVKGTGTIASGLAASSPESLYDDEEGDDDTVPRRRPSAMTMKSVRHRVSGFALDPEEREEELRPTIVGRSTLLALKLRMAQAATKEECLALLDGFMHGRNGGVVVVVGAVEEEEPIVEEPVAEPPSEPIAPVIEPVEEPKAEEGHDAFLASLAEFFLGDLPNPDAPFPVPSTAAIVEESSAIVEPEPSSAKEEVLAPPETETAPSTPIIVVDDTDHLAPSIPLPPSPSQPKSTTASPRPDVVEVVDQRLSSPGPMTGQFPSTPSPVLVSSA